MIFLVKFSSSLLVCCLVIFSPLWWIKMTNKKFIAEKLYTVDRVDQWAECIQWIFVIIFHPVDFNLTSLLIPSLLIARTVAHQTTCRMGVRDEIESNLSRVISFSWNMSRGFVDIVVTTVSCAWGRRFIEHTLLRITIAPRVYTFGCHYLWHHRRR